jgi:hypothetical protein
MTTKELSLKKGDAMFSSFEKIFKQLGNAVALVYCLLIILHGCDYFTVYCKKLTFHSGFSHRWDDTNLMEQYKKG